MYERHPFLNDLRSWWLKLTLDWRKRWNLTKDTYFHEIGGRLPPQQIMEMDSSHKTVPSMAFTQSNGRLYNIIGAWEAYMLYILNVPMFLRIWSHFFYWPVLDLYLSTSSIFRLQSLISLLSEACKISFARRTLGTLVYSCFLFWIQPGSEISVVTLNARNSWNRE